MRVVGPEDGDDGLVDKHSWLREQNMTRDRNGQGIGPHCTENWNGVWPAWPVGRTGSGSAFRLVVFLTEAL